jgi:hypothetical protein
MKKVHERRSFDAVAPTTMKRAMQAAVTVNHLPISGHVDAKKKKQRQASSSESDDRIIP